MSDRGKLVFAVVCLILLFVGGVGSGIAIDRLWLLPRHGPPHPMKKMLRGHPERWAERFASRLDLNEEQTTVVRAALEEAHRAMWAIRAESRPHMERITKTARDKISAVLNETQKAEFDRMAAERGAFGPGFRPGPGKRPFGDFQKRRFGRPPEPPPSTRTAPDTR